MVSMCRAGMISKLFYKLINQSSINTFYVLISLSRVFALFITKLNVKPNKIWHFLRHWPKKFENGLNFEDLMTYPGGAST
jgi:hypothetical protein